jgi:SAM-dependent methyltransferase
MSSVSSPPAARLDPAGGKLAALVDLAALAASTDSAQLAALGAQLRHAGVTPRALAAWAGTARIAALPARLEAIGAPDTPATPAAAVLALLVGGAELHADAWRLPDALLAPLAPLATCDLVERAGDHLRARVAIVPLGAALLVCDRLDAAIDRDLVCWPDDSSHHLATAIPPGRRADWLDLGCGSAFAPLARPELAHRITGIDLNPRAVRYAQLGAALSGIAHIAVARGDIADPQAPAELVTCNAPMPDPDDVPAISHRPHAVAGPHDAGSLQAGADSIPAISHRPHAIAGAHASGSLHGSDSSAPPRSPRLRGALPEIWRHADRGFFERLWPALLRAVRPGGLIVVHGACDALQPALAAAPGERVLVRYTPDGVPGFAIAWWRPDAPARLVSTHRALTAERPHLDPRDRDDALAAP